MRNIHLGKWKGDRNRNSKQKMRTRMGTKEFADRREDGAKGITKLLDRLLPHYDPDKRARERRTAKRAA